MRKKSEEQKKLDALKRDVDKVSDTIKSCEKMSHLRVTHNLIVNLSDKWLKSGLEHLGMLEFHMANLDRRLKAKFTELAYENFIQS
jgi:hypothetical protein